MANSGPNTNGDSIFHHACSGPWLDGKHMIFGRVKAGMTVVQKLGTVATDSNDQPVETIAIQKAKAYQGTMRLYAEKSVITNNHKFSSAAVKSAVRGMVTVCACRHLCPPCKSMLLVGSYVGLFDTQRTSRRNCCSGVASSGASDCRNIARPSCRFWVTNS